MSGPKDYEIVYDAARAALIAARLRALRQQRAAEIEQRTKAVAAQTRRRAQRILSQRAAANRLAEERRRQEASSTASKREGKSKERLAQARKETSPAMSKLLDEAREALAQVVELAGAPETNSVFQGLNAQLAVLEDRQTEEADGESAVQQLMQRIHQAREEIQNQVSTLSGQLEQVAGWQESLAQDEEVRRYQRDAHAAWLEQAGKVLAEESQPQSLEEALKSSQDVIHCAQQIHDRATELAAQFQARNELLANIMDSLKGVGFFVADPEYSDKSDPTGPVIVRASKGGEEMTTWVDLTQSIRSHWDQAEGEHCKESFFEYVDQMKKHGIDVQAKRADLQERPILRRQGARDLPAQRTDQRGT